MNYMRAYEQIRIASWSGASERHNVSGADKLAKPNYSYKLLWLLSSHSNTSLDHHDQVLNSDIPQNS
jgi:hypothetical protein